MSKARGELSATAHIPIRLNYLFTCLAMGLLVTCAFLIYDSVKARASSVISVTAKVGAVPPKQKAIIVLPSENQLISQNKVTVSGSCQPKTYVSLLNKGEIGGATICDEEGQFALEIGLSLGVNQLVAQTNDGIDQIGPNSAPVNVMANFSPGQNLGVGVDKAYQRIGLDNPLSWKINLTGESSIYAVNVDWGDGKKDLFPTSEKELTLNHKYESAGARAIKITASDALKNSSSLNLVASVSSLDTLNGGVIKNADKYLSNATLYITVSLMLASFLVGNYYQGGKKHVWSQKTADIT